MLLAHHDVALRVAPFALEDRWLFWTRARLYADRLELTGWFFRGRYHLSIPLVCIEEAASVDDHLVLRRREKPPLRLQLDAPEQWATAIATHRDIRTSSG